LIAAFSTAQYTPGLKNQIPVRARIYIEVVYVDGVLNSLPEQMVVLRPTEASPPIPAERPADRYKRHKTQ
jgi:hypothetical protein